MPTQTSARRARAARRGPHFVGRLVGEGQGEDLVAGHAVGQQPGDAMRDDARLAAARPGQDQQRPVVVRDRLALGVGEVFQEVLHNLIVAEFPRNCYTFVLVCDTLRTTVVNDFGS